LEEGTEVAITIAAMIENKDLLSIIQKECDLQSEMIIDFIMSQGF